MAARSKAYRSRLFMNLLPLITLLSVVSAADNPPVSSGDLGELGDRGSVKKELRNPDRWNGVGLAEEEEVQSIKGFFLDDGSQMLASFLRTVSNEELGVTALQAIYDGLPFGAVERDDAARVRELRDRLQRKLTHYTSLINSSRTAIEELFWHHLHRPLSTPAPCCELPESMLRFDSHFGAPVSEELACDVSTPTIKPVTFVPGHNLTDMFTSNAKMAPSIKWQYFLGADGGLSEYPSHRYDSNTGCNNGGGSFVPVGVQSYVQSLRRRNDLYLAAVHPEPQQVVVVVDHGSALSPNQLNLAKSIAKYIISGLSEKDHVGLVALSDEVHFAGTGDCFTKGLTRASQTTKLQLETFIDRLTKAKAPANHSLGFQQALDMARRAMLMSSVGSHSSETGHLPSVGDCPPAGSSTPVLLVYISRGLLSSLAEPRQVLELIALGQLCLQGRLVINTYALIDDGKPIMYEKAFLQDIASQNYSRYNVSFAALERLPILRGQALAINSSRWLSSTVGDYFSVLINSTASPSASASSSSSYSPSSSSTSSVSGLNQQQLTYYSPPRWDPVGKGLVVSLTAPCYHLDQLIGAVGLDVHLADLVEDFTYFNPPGGRSYVFLIDSIGTVMMHPSLIRPSNVIQEPVSTDIGLLESHPGFSAIRRRMLSTPSGSERLPLPEENDEDEGDDVETSSEDDDDEHMNATLTYTWEKAGPYIACLVTRNDNSGNGGVIQMLRRVPPTSSQDVVYHRLDLMMPAGVGVGGRSAGSGGLGSQDLCRYFRSASTLAAASLYLSPAAHLSSFQFESWAEPSSSVIQSFMTYLGDRTKLIANPGLRPAVRSDVGALTQLVPYWKSQFGHSLLSQFVVRRYVSTPSGVLIEYPATVRPASHDPHRRPWYRKALDYPGRVIMTGPSLDPSGSGYIVSVSHTVYEGKPAGVHSQSDSVVAVLGADLTLSYVHRLLWVTLPFCPDRAGQLRDSSVRCFLMDERGYLLAHPNLLDPQLGSGGSAVEGQHLTHHEPLVASDLLNHDRFVLKKACSSWSDRTAQRFYQLNLTLNDQWTLRTDGAASNGGAAGLDGHPPVPVLTNLIHGEHCIRYQIVAVPGTNLFVGVVNQTCESATAFCPCSTVDRLCLNCHRMEQSECECPCECPLEQDACASETEASLEAGNLPTCPAQPEPAIPSPPSSLHTSSHSWMDSVPPPSASRNRDALLDLLPACLIPDCEDRMTEKECYGVVGCEWCVRDGPSILQVPFCTHHAKCYNGILRGPSPYSDDSGLGDGLHSGSDSDSSFMKTLPVGPVLGGVMAFFAFVGLSVYCYRQQTKRRRHASGGYEGASGSPGGGHELRMTHLDGGHDDADDDMEPDAGDETTAVVSREFSLGSRAGGLDNVAIVSPYRVNTGYRRPAGGDSDHGYSTAGYSYSTSNQHDDSEHTGANNHSSSFVEPLLIGRDRYRPTAVRSSTSVGSFSSRASSPLGPVYQRRPGTLHESADELEDGSNSQPSSKWTSQNKHQLPPPIRQLDDTNLGMTTILPDSDSFSSSNQVVVPVTVHMVDTA